MVISHYKLLHYVLIVLLMFAPVRGAMALQQVHCNMDDMVMESHDMASMPSTDTKQQADRQCCCCDGADCASNCDMGMTVSLVIQQTPYIPVFKKVSESITISANILLRELTPPSRPPANLHN
jgi:hypothetical protein